MRRSLRAVVPRERTRNRLRSARRESVRLKAMRALEASRACIWELDTRTDEVVLSPGWAAIIGAPAGETRTTIQELAALVHPDDAEAAIAASTQTIKGTQDEYAVEHRVRDQRGEWRWILSRGKVIERSPDARALRLSGINVDIHERKLAETALEESRRHHRSLAKLHNGSYWETDTAHRLVAIDFGQDFVPVQPLEAQLGKAIWEKPSTAPGEAEWAALRATFDRHEPFRNFELSRPTSDGGERHSVISGEPRFDARGRFLGYYGMSRDVTDRVIALRRARVADERMRSAIENLDEVIALTDAQERFVLVNRAFREMSKGAEEFLVSGRHYADYLAAMAAAGNVPDSAGREAAWVAERMALRREAGHQLERPLPNGRWMLIHDQKLPDGGTITYGFDITERRRNEEALRRANQRLEDALVGGEISIWDADLRSGEVWLSDGWSVLMDAPRGETHTTMDELIALTHPDDIGEVLRMTRETIRGERDAYVEEHRIRTASGKWRWVLCRGRVTERGPDGRALRMSGTNVDLTVRKAHEDRIRRFQAALDSMTDAMYLADPATGLIVDASAGAERALGYAREELIGMPVETLFADRDGEGLRREYDAFTSGALQEQQLRAMHRRKDGTPFPVEIRRRSIESDGRRIVVGIARDVSERERAEHALAESEARFRAVFERSRAGIAIWGVDGRFINANAAFCDLVGYAANELIGTMVIGDLRDPEIDRGSTTTQRLLLGEIAGATRDRAYRRRDGGLVWGRTTVTAVKGKDARAEYFIAVVIDVTEAHQARERIEKLNVELEQRVRERTAALSNAVERLEDANRGLDSFNFSISHDLRQPLNAIVGYADLLRDDLSAPALAGSLQFADEIAANAGRMAAMIESLLQFSRADRSEIRRVQVDMKRQVEEILASHARGAPLRAQVVVGDLPAAQGDETLLRQVWANLIGNALKYSGSQEAPRIEISGGRNAGTLVYAVRDNGVGFDMRDAALLFGVFQRLPSSAGFEGTGVGLAIVRRVVERHGGEIGVESAPGQGATFRFTLPG